MTWTFIANYFSSNWLEVAGLITTVVGIWLTTRRTLLCWPIVLAADVIYLIVFYRAQLLSDALLQIFFVAFTLYGWWHWWRGVREEGTVRVVPLAMRKPFDGPCRRRSRQFCVGGTGQASARSAALPGCHPHQLQSRSELVAGAQSTRQTGGSGLSWIRCTSVSICTRICERPRCSMPGLSRLPPWVCAIGDGLRSLSKLPPAPRSLTVHRPCSGAIRLLLS